MHNGRLSYLTNLIRMYKLQWVEGYRGFWLVILKCDYADVDLIWYTDIRIRDKFWKMDYVTMQSCTFEYTTYV